MTDRETLNKYIAEICGKATKVEVVDNPAPHTYRHLVCMRVEDVPIPATEARIENCPKCSSRIWVSTNSPTGPNRICYHCFLPVIVNEQELTIGISTKTAQKLRAKP